MLGDHPRVGPGRVLVAELGRAGLADRGVRLEPLQHAQVPGRDDGPHHGAQLLRLLSGQGLLRSGPGRGVLVEQSLGADQPGGDELSGGDRGGEPGHAQRGHERAALPEHRGGVLGRRLLPRDLTPERGHGQLRGHPDPERGRGLGQLCLVDTVVLVHEGGVAGVGERLGEGDRAGELGRIGLDVVDPHARRGRGRRALHDRPGGVALPEHPQGGNDLEGGAGRVPAQQRGGVPLGARPVGRGDELARGGADRHDGGRGLDPGQQLLGGGLESAVQAHRDRFAGLRRDLEQRLAGGRLHTVVARRDLLDDHAGGAAQPVVVAATTHNEIDFARRFMAANLSMRKAYGMMRP